MDIVAATTNEHKLREIKHILKGTRVWGSATRVKENGKTFEANAIKKARAASKKTNMIAISDDSGLMVNCLNGRPGVRSARFASPPTPENLCGKLLRVMRSRRAKSSRHARFVCVIAVAFPNGKIRTVKGVVNGRIIDEMRGKRGFGYDPVFMPDGHKKTFAEMRAAQKNKISHRGKALRKLRGVFK